MFDKLIATDRSWNLFVQRAVLGAVILPHGMQKLFGWWGGYGFDGTMGFFTETLGVPAPLGLLVILADSLGAIAIVLGLGTRLAAAGTIATMLGAILMWHLPNGFFMNWSGSQPGEGFEFHLLALALAVPLAILGGGSYSLDRVIALRTARAIGRRSPSASGALRALTQRS